MIFSSSVFVCGDRISSTCLSIVVVVEIMICKVANNNNKIEKKLIKTIARVFSFAKQILLLREGKRKEKKRNEMK